MKTEHQITLDEALELAAGRLPYGSRISIECEEGAAWVVATRGDSEELQQAGDGSLADQVMASIEFCRGEGRYGCQRGDRNMSRRDKEIVLRRYPGACAEQERSGEWWVMDITRDEQARLREVLGPRSVVSPRALLGMGSVEKEAWNSAARNVAARQGWEIPPLWEGDRDD